MSDTEGWASTVVFPQRDEGTKTAEQVQGPVTVESPAPGEPTGVAEQQPAETTYADLTHADPPTGVAEQINAPVTTYADWSPTPGAKAVKPDEPVEDKVVAADDSDVDDKAVKPRRTTKRAPAARKRG